MKYCNGAYHATYERIDSRIYLMLTYNTLGNGVHMRQPHAAASGQEGAYRVDLTIPHSRMQVIH